MRSDSVTIRLLGPRNASVLDEVDPDVFDAALKPDLIREFLADPRHHIAVALDESLVVGFASAFHYLHPDKPAQLFVNEVGVAASHQRRGIGRELMAALLAHGRSIGCTEAWVGTEDDNTAARGLYADVDGAKDAEPFVLYSFPLGAKS